MGPNTDSRVLRALAQAIRPIVRLLVRNSVDCRSVIEVVKSVFVQVVAEEYGVHGRQTSLSRISAITNLNRKEVKRIRDSLSDGNIVGKVPPIAVDRVLRAWHTDPVYQNDDGTVADLPFRNGEASFTELVKRVGRDVPPGAIKTELVRLGLAEMLDDERIRALASEASMQDDENEIVAALEEGLLPAAECITHNVFHKKQDQQWPFILATADTSSESDLPTIREASFYAINRFCDDLPAEFRPVSKTGTRQSAKTPSVRVGIFHYEIPAEEEKQRSTA